MPRPLYPVLNRYSIGMTKARRFPDPEPACQPRFVHPPSVVRQRPLRPWPLPASTLLSPLWPAGFAPWAVLCPSAAELSMLGSTGKGSPQVPQFSFCFGTRAGLWARTFPQSCTGGTAVARYNRAGLWQPNSLLPGSAARASLCTSHWTRTRSANHSFQRKGSSHSPP